MKCPKCGYTSFDYLDTCKKCSYDLSAVRSMLGVIAVAPDDLAVASPRGPSMGGDAMAGATVVEDFNDINFGIQPASISPDMQEEDEEIDLGSFVEPTQYSSGGGEHPSESAPKTAAQPQPPPAQPRQAAAKGQEEDEFLDLDFGGIFEEDEEKKK